MSNLIDADAGTERFGGYEAELKLVQADLSQQIEQIKETTGEPRKAAISRAERALEEAEELIGQMRIEKSNIPANLKSKYNARFRNFEHDIDTTKRKLETYTSDRSKLFGDRYTDNPEGGDAQLEQRQQLLSGTDRLNRSSGRLRESQRIALETEQIGANTLGDLHRQREQIVNTRERLLESETYTDRSIKTLRGMARRMATNRIITIAIITVLVLLIMAVIYSKFR
ncbi:vesicle transport v-snare protein [Pyrenophora tritici-repentis]|uniref:Vesicle transport v-snare protein n=2 Tax=Pyrenophora tritici-repentis TaxID=45151 RepID=A0A2W1D0B6_9PLEO|nr:vesicle transport v-snare protein [Pyrenophora tritici-repentis Pt-1C-BFP]KAA8619198.1 Vesicle transport v-snare protein [Pyrenophora tritici-repentis]EDU48983.1 vesicle transport v-snare protein [Pyrenophora tritici-repentis Pt-1C-BFP]KAF7449669.1 Vesicle transport v-snare protein [Pyrenophora tritici-repentis]KAF7570210.1 vesicle transport v-snare protein [Pyrenophora tritici-repentis]KAG9383403.1 Vesicle transport v-snare protein [Pyrenophora tritici-repentis]